MESNIDGNKKYINYSIAVNDVSSLTTTDGTLATASAYVIDNSSGFGTVKVDSKKISVKINKGQFDEAVQGTYTGTVTFNWYSN